MAICLQAIRRNDVSLWRVLLFPLQNRGPKEDGVRNAKVNRLKGNQVVIRGVRGSCRLPRFVGTPRTVKSFVKNSSGHQLRFAELSPGLSKRRLALELL
jgi:hypothetical protein